jgi:hypothetical protein
MSTMMEDDTPLQARCDALYPWFDALISSFIHESLFPYLSFLKRRRHAGGRCFDQRMHELVK